MGLRHMDSFVSMTAVVDGIPSDGQWFLAQAGTREEPIMIRARSDILPLLPAKSLSMRIVVGWSCWSPNQFGLPSSDDYAEITAFEETLLSHLEEGAILAFTHTTGGVVEYNFYTADTEWFLDRLNEALEDTPPVPIEIGAEEDPDWTEYRSLMQAVAASVESAH
jgi:hypothetical protein